MFIIFDKKCKTKKRGLVEVLKDKKKGIEGPNQTTSKIKTFSYKC